MKQNWGFYNEEPFDSVNQEQQISLLPSSLRDIWDIDSPIETSRNRSQMEFPSSIGQNYHNNRVIPFSESAPPMQYMDMPQQSYEDMAFTGEIEPEGGPLNLKYYQIQFHPFRTVVFKASDTLSLQIGDYVLTEADRGFDVGKIINEVPKPPARDLKSAKFIVRKAVQSEISQLPQKAEREAKAMELCQIKAREMGLPMKITGAVFQFDGKKLIFYYKADCYVDFRNLVRSLFKIYGTRIWMVWHDGNTPVNNSFMAQGQRTPMHNNGLHFQ
ncbi:PSP1 C-terminal conserved region family protein [Histomonas meleagridis]|uniref:PSP1 C-terminal conserved region family protein n=1 Tax=Histomonas meleagridis TaxID=135588 RepID=UPI0035595771|nr:PSP1 C-terminal conserved region family protein [Histomonas meleagridis]KAH0798674.1 PSP1 C-terminal conserved region family protein [Histomonas meleagridis]